MQSMASELGPWFRLLSLRITLPYAVCDWPTRIMAVNPARSTIAATYVAGVRLSFGRGAAFQTPISGRSSILGGRFAGHLIGVAY